MKKNKRYKMIIETIGSPNWPRYRIFDRERGYWGRISDSDEGWVKEPVKSILYYQNEDAAKVVKDIQTVDNIGKPVKKFEGKITVELVGDTALDMEKLIEYLVKEARLSLDSPGPDNTTVHLQIDWSTLKEAENGPGVPNG